MERLTKRGEFNGITGIFVNGKHGGNTFYSAVDEAYPAIERLADIEDLADQGRLVWLPDYKIDLSDDCYAIIHWRDSDGKLKPELIDGMIMGAWESTYTVLSKDGFFYHINFENVFKTRTAAQARLAELEDLR